MGHELVLPSCQPVSLSSSGGFWPLLSADRRAIASDTSLFEFTMTVKTCLKIKMTLHSLCSIMIFGSRGTVEAETHSSRDGWLNTALHLHCACSQQKGCSRPRAYLQARLSKSHTQWPGCTAICHLRTVFLVWQPLFCQ